MFECSAESHSLLLLTIEDFSRLKLDVGSDQRRRITWGETGVDVEQQEADLVCYTSCDGKPVELTESWSYGVSRLQSFGKLCGTLEDGGIRMKSRIWKIDQNRVALVKARDDQGLNQSLETQFIEAAFYLAYSSQMKETGFCDR